ncbi:hypothetical protein HK096_001744, partial [Nowakowskiella sp. JEL0078]
MAMDLRISGDCNVVHRRYQIEEWARGYLLKIFARYSIWKGFEMCVNWDKHGELGVGSEDDANEGFDVD